MRGKAHLKERETVSVREGERDRERVVGGMEGTETVRKHIAKRESTSEGEIQMEGERKGAQRKPKTGRDKEAEAKQREGT